MSSSYDNPSGELASNQPPSTTSSSNAAAGDPAAMRHIPTDQQKTVISKQPPLVEPRFRFGVNPQELGSILEGEMLGHFRLEEFVGGGGMGAVFRATDTMLGRMVAVKVLSRDQTDTDTLRRFQNEAQSAARLDHDNIARVYYVSEDKGVNYIVFEFIEGVNIRDLVDHKGPLPLEEAINYTLQVAEALEHAHHRDVVHRDIKPSNILVTPEGRAKLVDMGLARLHQMESASEDITASGVTLGTFDYISPEQARDPRSADVRSDLYSLGCTLYFMLTGQAPFPEGTVLQKLLSHSSDAPPDPSRYRSDLDEPTIRVLAKMMAKQPGDRYQSPGELIRDLLLIIEALGLTASGQKVLMQPLAARMTAAGGLRRQIPWIIPVAALLLGVPLLELVQSRPPADDNLQIDLAPPWTLPAAPTEPPADSGEQVAVPTAPPPPQPSTVVPHRAEQVDQRRAPARVEPSGVDANPVEASRTQDVVETSPSQRVADDESTPGQIASATGDPVAGDRSPTQRNGDAQDDDTPPADGTIRTIYVGTDESPPPGVEVVPSLGMAIQRAHALGGVQQIELHFDGRRIEYPFDVVAEDLTIKAGVGFRPEIVFQPDVDEFPQGAAAVVRVLGGSLRWQDVHLRFEVPSEWIDTWTMFQLHSVQRLMFTDCVMTIRNLHEDGSVFHDRVSFFELMPTKVVHSSSMDPDQVTGQRPEIRLDRCIARGQATLVRMAKETPFWLVWDQGLLISTERLLETRGMATLPTTSDQRINVDMQNVTVLARRGICRLAISEKLPHHLDLIANWVSSIVVTDSDAALYEQIGTDGKGEDIQRLAGELLKRLSVRGRDNIYPNTSSIVRVSPTTSASESLQLAPEDRPDFDRWYDEMGALFGSRIEWESAANISLDRQTKYDYLPRFVDAESPSLVAGFTLSSLPEIVDDLTSSGVVHPP